MFIPLKYNIRNLLVRRTATLLTAFGIAVSVAVFVSVMALVEGMDDTFVTTGDARNIIALRRGALSETGSIIDIGAPLIVRNFPGVEAMSAERLVYVNTARLGTGSSNVVIRGLGDTGRALRPQVHLLRGRWYRPGARELTVSRSIASRFRDTDLGDELKTGSARWKVVGIFDAGNTAYSSEMWTDPEGPAAAFQRRAWSDIVVRATNKAAIAPLLQMLDAESRIDVDARSEVAYFAEQTKASSPVRVLGNVVAIIMAVGSAFAAMNTMYAAVGSRTREIAVLRALGFSGRSVALSFLSEAVLLSIVGGVVGGLAALPLNGIATGTTNWFTFAEMNFAFAITPPLLGRGILFAVLMGAVGGVLPALRASRLSAASAMRAL
jgi:putative ABC transport system permease protein